MPKKRKPKVKILSTKGRPRYVIFANNKPYKSTNSKKRAKAIVNRMKKTGLVK
jgi:hypothetical protein